MSGLVPTKTLAKVANHLAKRTPMLDGVCDPERRAGARRRPGRSARWRRLGRGPGLCRAADGHGGDLAGQLRDLNPRQARAVLSVVGERLVLELRAQTCLSWDEVPAGRKGCAVTEALASRSRT